MKYKTWTIVPLPTGKNLVGCKWIYKTNISANGHIEKHISWLVEKELSQQEGIHYGENFAPVAKMNPIKNIISLATSYQQEIHQMDVNSTFLNGHICDDIYMQQPFGFIIFDTSILVC